MVSSVRTFAADVAAEQPGELGLCVSDQVHICRDGRPASSHRVRNHVPRAEERRGYQVQKAIRVHESEFRLLYVQRVGTPSLQL